MLEELGHPTSSVTIELVGKYVARHDAYLSVAEALKHGGIANRTQVNIRWIDAEELTPENLEEYLHDVDGILVPGGFGQRGTEGKILAIGYARRNKIPYLGLCLGMQLAIVEFARNVAGLSKAASIELDPETPDPVIALRPHGRAGRGRPAEHFGQLPVRRGPSRPDGGGKGAPQPGAPANSRADRSRLQALTPRKHLRFSFQRCTYERNNSRARS